MEYKLDKYIYIYTCLREVATVLQGIFDQLVLSSISPHFNRSFMQQKQQTFGHNNIPFLEWQNMFVTSNMHVSSILRIIVAYKIWC